MANRSRRRRRSRGAPCQGADGARCGVCWVEEAGRRAACSWRGDWRDHATPGGCSVTARDGRSQREDEATALGCLFPLGSSYLAALGLASLAPIRSCGRGAQVMSTRGPSSGGHALPARTAREAGGAVRRCCACGRGEPGSWFVRDDPAPLRLGLVDAGRCYGPRAYDPRRSCSAGPRHGARSGRPLTCPPRRRDPRPAGPLPGRA